MVLPAGTPSDEEPVLFAASVGDATGWREGRCELGSDGNLRIPVAKNAVRAILRIEARYLYFAHTPELAPDSKSVRVEPNLGAWMSGRFRLASKEAFAESFDVRLENWRGKRARFEASVDRDGAFELRGIPADRDYLLVANPRRFAPVLEAELRLAPGEHFERTWNLQPGARVEGRVVGADGAPLGGVHILAQTWGALTGRGLEGETTTGTSGAFVLEGLLPGKLTLAATLRDYRSAESAPIDLEPGEVHTGLALTLTRGDSLAGQVVWPDGEPAAKATVTVHEEVTAGVRTRWQDYLDHEVSADPGGRFTVDGLSGGALVLRATASRPQDGTWFAKAESDGPVSELKLVLQPPSRFTGAVVDDQGFPVSDFRVTFGEKRPAGRATYSAETREVSAEDGTFTLEGLAPGRWAMTVTAADYAAADFEVVLPDEPGPLLITLARTAQVTGEVVDPEGTPVRGARVEAKRSGGRRSAHPGVVTDEAGTFALRALPPEALELVAHHEFWAPSEPKALVLEPASDLQDVRLVLRRGGGLRGEVFDAQGQPDAGRNVAVRDPLSGTVHTLVADGAGHFAADRLAAGLHQVMAFPTGEERDLLRDVLTQSVDIVPGEIAHVVLGSPASGAVRVRGRVTRASSALPGARVTALPEGRSIVGSMTFADTDASGSYELNLRGAGDYVLRVEPARGGGEGAEFPRTIEDVDELELDLDLPSAILRGRVLTADGAPAINVEVSYSRAGASAFSSGATLGRTDSAGAFAFEGLEPDTYTVRAGGRRFAAKDSQAHYGIAVRTGVVVDSDLPAEVELRLGRAGSILGHVWSSEGQPIPGAVVFVRNEEGQLLNPLSTTETSADGSFGFSGCAPGFYSVSARRGGEVTVESELIQVAAGGETPVELTLEAGTILRVTLVDESGELLRVAVEVHDAAQRVVGTGRDAASVAEAMTRGFSTREARIGPLAPGRYTVRARATDGRQAESPIKLGGESERELRLRLAN